jgi:hypothetical protein
MRPPTLDEPAYSPEAAATLVGKVCTVEYRVAAAGGSDHLYLKASADEKALTPFTARINSGLIAPGNRDQLVTQFEGKTVRVRGKVEKAPRGTATVEVGTFEQLLIVPKRQQESK